jgi:hypothetical protein
MTFPNGVRLPHREEFPQVIPSSSIDLAILDVAENVVNEASITLVLSSFWTVVLRFENIHRYLLYGHNR